MRKLSLFSALPTTVVTLLVLLAGPPQRAAAEAGLFRPMPGEIVLAFNDGYTLGDGQTRYHTGVDIAGAAGAGVKAAGAGRVTFCGRVPAPGLSGERALALTVTMTDGRLATYLPLETASVAKGDEVEQGKVIGILAAAGDGSTAATHLHLGLRENGNYVDPGPLPLPLPPAQPAPHAAPQPHQSAARRPALAPPASSIGRAAAIPSGTTLVPSHISAPKAPPVPSASLAAAPAAGPVPRITSEQRWLHARLLRANRRMPWIDPRILAAMTGTRAKVSPRPSAAPWPSRQPKASSILLLLVSGALLAAASLLGAAARRAARLSVPTVPHRQPAKVSPRA